MSAYDFCQAALADMAGPIPKVSLICELACMKYYGSHSFVSGLIRAHSICRNMRFYFCVRRGLLFTRHRLVLRSHLS
jgi:hypothetical protein